MGKKNILLVAGFLVFLNFLCWQEVFVLAGKNYLEVSFMDVGQGDSIFIETPEGHQIIIDGGPNSRILEKLAERMPFWDKSIDVLILTHPEKDHITGLIDVLERYKVNYFVWNGIPKDDAQNKKLLEILEKLKNENKITVVAAGLGSKIIANNALFNVLGPAKDSLKKDANENSLVLKLSYGSSKFLFTGDIGFKVEREIAGRENLEADVLKVAHHGSKYSTSDLFLAGVSPMAAVISVGKNSYGHPTQEVLQKLNDFGARVLRTDENGDITILSNGTNLKIK